MEIDYCPSCRGVWLDRGELDKILLAAKTPDVAVKQENSYPWHHSDDRGEKPKKRKSFLEELFD